jgi:ubiquinone/menaquinone biosynthesis C-methylase UbiE
MGLEQHKNYDHYSTDTIKRLDGFYGVVSDRMNRRIANMCIGSTVLDVGCGFGDLTEYLRQKNLSSVGVDMLDDYVTAGQKRFPYTDIRHQIGNTLDFPDKSFDTLILKDTLHHIFEESDIHAFMNEAKRVTKQRIIFFDPNPMWILRMARSIVGHVDAVCSPKDALSILYNHQMIVRDIRYFDTLSLPLSGGYIARPYVRNKGIGSVVMGIDTILENIFRVLHIDSALCWRYMIVADIQPDADAKSNS